MQLDKLFINRTTALEGVFSNKTNKLYPSTLNALLDNNNIEDLSVSWEPVRDWTKGRTLDNISSLAVERLQELRDTYKHLQLSWGGGYDSSYILHVATENNIPFDSVVMYGINNIEDPHPYNLEHFNNKWYLDEYIKKFPSTTIRHVNLLDMVPLASQHKDYDLWASGCYGQWDDVLMFYADNVLPERQEQGTAVIVGSGFKQVVYNAEHKLWSLLINSVNLNCATPGSLECDTIRFYETPCMVNSIAHMATKYNRTLSLNELQRLVIYKDQLPKPIWHIPKESQDWKQHPKMNWYTQGQYTLYNEFIEAMNNKIDPVNWKSEEGFIDGWKDFPKIIDFYKE